MAGGGGEGGTGECAIVLHTVFVLVSAWNYWRTLGQLGRLCLV